MIDLIRTPHFVIAALDPAIQYAWAHFTEGYGGYRMPAFERHDEN
jgi:hypothetical protein